MMLTSGKIVIEQNFGTIVLKKLATVLANYATYYIEMHFDKTQLKGKRYDNRNISKTSQRW